MVLGGIGGVDSTELIAQIRKSAERLLAQPAYAYDQPYYAYDGPLIGSATMPVPVHASGRTPPRDDSATDNAPGRISREPSSRP